MSICKQLFCSSTIYVRSLDCRACTNTPTSTGSSCAPARRSSATSLRRHLDGELADEEFRALRLQNGWYVQRHAPMLRVAVPYGELSSRQLRELARIAREYDRGYGHFTTRQNLQFNWIPLARAADVMDLLAERRHARHPDQRQLHPQHHQRRAGRHRARRDRRPAALLRDPAPVEHAAPGVRLPAAQVQDRRHRRARRPRRHRLARHRPAAAEERRPARSASRCWSAAAWAARRSSAASSASSCPGSRSSSTSRPSCASTTARPARQHVQGAHQDPGQGRRPEASSTRSNAEFRQILEHDVDGARTPDSAGRAGPRGGPLPAARRPRRAPRRRAAARRAGAEAPLAYTPLARAQRARAQAARLPRRDAVAQARRPARPATPPATRWTAPPNWPTRFSHGELRVTHDQNLLLPWVHESELPALWHAAREAGFATPNIGLLTDMIACPGGDFCALANARSIPVAAAITERFEDLDELYDIGDIDLHISGCINSCGHHHSGHIGILGVDKDGAEWYQITLGGSDGTHAQRRGHARQGDRPVVRRRRGARRHRGRDRHLPPRAPAGRTLHRHQQAARHRALPQPPPTPCGAATAAHRGLKENAMRFIDTRQDRWHRVDGEDGPIPHPDPQADRLLDAGTVARRARAPGRAAWPLACCCPTRWTWTRWPSDLRGPTRACRWWCCSSRSGPTAAPTARRACCARATASTARCAPSARCWSTCCRCCSAPASTRSQLRRDQSVEAAVRALGFFPGHYQGDVLQPRPAFARDLAAEAGVAARLGRTVCRPRDLSMSAIALYARAGAHFDERLAHTVAMLQSAAAEHAGAIVQATSLGAEDMVLTDLIARHRLPIAVGTLDTGMLHAQTLALIPRIEARYGLRVERHAPQAEAVVQFVRQHGEQPMYRSIELRKACCDLRKLQPLARMLAGAQRLGHRPAPRAVREPRRRALQRARQRRAHQVQPAGRLELGRRLALHRHARRALQRTARPVLPQHRLRALHPRHRRGRGLPRRPLVVGETKAPRSAACTLRNRQRGNRRMNAPLSIEHLLPALDQQAPRLARGRSHLHPARGGGQLRAPRAAVLRRQGFLRRAAAGREGLQDRISGNEFKGRLPFPLLHVDTGHNFPEVIEFRDRRVAEMGERLVVGHLDD